jgi:hypothetical protein
MDVPASMTAFDGPGAVVSTVGRTIDLSCGGCRLVTDEPFPLGSEPTVSLRFDGATVLARAAIIERVRDGGAFHYRVMFTDLDDEDRALLDKLVAV